jgi:peptidoglycan hydrolase-like protein with peptidoglycan-binding domain
VLTRGAGASTVDGLGATLWGHAMSIDILEWDGDLGADQAELCDGTGDDTLEGSGDARSRGWGSGWPDCQTRNLNTIVVTKKLRLSVRREIAPLVAWLCDETIRRGYDLRSGQCWGFACRAIRGSRSPSNHSWGLAIDLNSLANPMGARLVTDMPGWMPELWTEHGFRWGGSYNGRKDAMHFEYMGTPEKAARQAARVGQAVALQPVAKQVNRDDRDRPDGPPRFPLPAGHWFGKDPSSDEGHDGTRPEDRPPITRIQRRLKHHGFDVGPDGTDGRFGPDVHDAVTAFQRRAQLKADGVVGAKTWGALW